MQKEGSAPINNEAGVTAILEFDPELGEKAKPDWLESKVQEPVDAILAWMNKKIAEVFQLSHLSGVGGQEKSDSVRSGVALRYEYQQLSLVLSKKSEQLTETELGIIKYWLKWQNKSKQLEGIKITRSKDFSIDDLSQNLENAIMADKLIPEMVFKRELMKVVAKRVLPDVPDSTLLKIYEAIDALEDTVIKNNEDTVEPDTTNRSTKDIRQELSENTDLNKKPLRTEE